MGLLKDIAADIKAVPGNPFLVAFSNRGFHSLLVYRLSNLLFRLRLSFLSLILTRLVQIVYGIDISYKATIAGGVCIVHGVGLVVGNGVKIGAGVKIYHGVTLGILDACGVGDGFPDIRTGVMLGAGSCVLGPVVVGANSIVGANSVVLKDVPAEMVAVGVPATARVK